MKRSSPTGWSKPVNCLEKRCETLERDACTVSASGHLAPFGGILGQRRYHVPAETNADAAKYRDHDKSVVISMDCLTKG